MVASVPAYGAAAAPPTPVGGLGAQTGRTRRCRAGVLPVPPVKECRMPRTHGHRNRPVQHRPSDFATSKPTQAQTPTAQAPAQERDGSARGAPQGPPQHKV